MESNNNFFDAWLKSQELIIENLAESTKNFQHAFCGLGVNKPGENDFLHVYTSWTTAVLNSLREMDTTDMGLLKETLSKALGGSNSYTKLFEIWLPLFKAIQEKGMNPYTYKDLSNPAEYKKILDQVFGFDPDAISQVSAQVKKFIDTFACSAGSFMNPWVEASRKSLKTFPQFLEGHPESFMSIFHNMFNAFDGTVGRIFHVPAVGKDREKIELLMRSLDDLSVYLAKSTEYQHMMYVTGLAAFEKVIATVAEKISRGEEIKGFDEFFDLWVDVSERTYHALFQTEDFSKMQGEVLEASVNARKHFFKLMELHLYDFPIALRSEMDDLYKTIYELKKKVNGLEKQLKEVSA
ncbi:MAG: poly(R)-hydroxyalkanoic acid synthase subunit PhaE [Dissulfurispiraceae bacterium]|jgi:class III poly(R)-hydroxyalkanoic acid synthase PhaE subunit